MTHSRPLALVLSLAVGTALIAPAGAWGAPILESVEEATNSSAAPVVLSSGNLSLTPRIDRAGVDLVAKNFTAFELGVLDKTGAYADQQWYPADGVVIHLDEDHHDLASGTWSTPAEVGDLEDFLAAGGLVLGNDSGTFTGGINADVAKVVNASPSGPQTLTGLSGPDDGRLRTFRPGGSVDAPVWDSSWLSTDQVQGTMTVAKASIRQFYGWTFDQPGTYCVSVAETLATAGSKENVTSQAVLTIVVGDIPQTIPPCNDDGGENDDGGDDGMAPITVLSDGHTDVRAWLSSDGTQLDVGAYKGKFIDSEDLVLGGTRSATVPEQTKDTDLTFIGAPGTEYWYYAQGGAPSGFLWPGFSTENFGTAEIGDGGIAFTLSGISGPADGEVMLFNSNAYSQDKSASGVYFNSGWRLPYTWTQVANSHTHMDWVFTQQGRYCLNFSVAADLRGSGVARGGGQITIWVGDPSAISQVVPCDRDTPATTPSPEPPAISTSEVHRLASGESVTLAPNLTAGELAVSALTRVHTSSGAVGRDPQDLLVSSTRKVSDRWVAFANPTLGQSPFLEVTTDYLLPGVDGVQLKLVSTTGPGTFSVKNSSTVILDSERLDLSRNIMTPYNGGIGVWSFTEPGVYCVGVEWSLLADGSVSGPTVKQVLTFVLGSDDPSSPDYVNRSELTTCARGQQPTPPGDAPDTDPGDEEPDLWDVPNGSATLSGATILNNGHIDIASLLDGGRLVTRIKDTTASSDPTWRDPAQAVLQLLPGSRTQVPGDTHYAFLGPVGADLWQVTQTQQDGLLWPGWSTESIPVSATEDGVRWTLTAASGPGEFALYEAGFQLGTVVPIFNTRDGITAADTYLIPKDTHAHGTWAFSAEGVYCLAFTRSTTPTGASKATDDFVIAVAVGEVDVRAVDPAACFTSPAGEPSERDMTPIPDIELTEDTGGDVQVLNGANGFTPGQLVTVQVGEGHSGEWVSAWLHSDPKWLGWAQVGTSGAIQVRLPVDAALGGHRIVVKDRDGNLIGWDAISIVAPPDTTVPPTPPAQDPTYPNAQCVAGSTILSSGHIDYASRIVGGKLESLVGDDTGGSKVYREPDGVILWLKPSSAVTLPAGYGAVGAAGSTVWQVPQTQNANLIWLGWSTEALNAGNTSGQVTWTLNSVSGPGSVKVYTTGSFGGVSMVLNGSGSSYAIPLGTHAHANWAFSAEGVYRLSMTQTVTLANGKTSSDTETLTIVVGDVDPASAAGGSGCGAISNAILGADDADAAKLSADQASAAAALAARDVLPGQGSGSGGFVDPITALNQGNPMPLLLSILGVLLLAGAAGSGVLWWRRRRVEA